MNAAPVTVQALGARRGGRGRVTLTVSGGRKLRLGQPTRSPINNLTWTATGAGFVRPARSDARTAQQVGSWTGPGARNGTQTYTLVEQLGVRAGYLRGRR